MILVGEKGSGKSSVVKQAAGVAGVSLHTLVLNNSSDISDIIGAFEQKTLHNHT